MKSWSQGKISAEFHISEKYHNSRGHLFGGYFGVLADMTFCYTVMTVLKDEGYSTSDLRITYFRPVSSGTLHIEGRVLHRSKKSVHVEALFNDDEGRLVAKADGVMSIIPMSTIYPKKE
ncbi:MAG: PaaI family thioesterase [Dehalococcoidia bacterium]